MGNARIRTFVERPLGCCNPDVWHINSVVMIDVWHVKYRAASESIIRRLDHRVTDIIMYKEAREFIDPWHIYRTFAFRVNKRVMVTSTRALVSVPIQARFGGVRTGCPAPLGPPRSQSVHFLRVSVRLLQSRRMARPLGVYERQTARQIQGLRRVRAWATCGRRRCRTTRSRIANVFPIARAVAAIHTYGTW